MGSHIGSRDLWVRSGNSRRRHSRSSRSSHSSGVDVVAVGDVVVVVVHGVSLLRTLSFLSSGSSGSHGGRGSGTGLHEHARSRPTQMRATMKWRTWRLRHRGRSWRAHEDGIGHRGSRRAREPTHARKTPGTAVGEPHRERADVKEQLHQALKEGHGQQHHARIGDKNMRIARSGSGQGARQRAARQ